jgi:hypothetical protein
MMITVKAFIERGNIAAGETQPFYSVYVDIDDERLSCGILGDGYSPEEAAEDFLLCYEEAKEDFAERGEPFVEAFFVFVKDFDGPHPLNLPEHIVRNQRQPTSSVKRTAKRTAVSTLSGRTAPRQPARI